MNNLSELEKSELENRTKALSPEEMSVVLKNIPSEFIFAELKLRDAIKQRILSDIESALREA